MSYFCPNCGGHGSETATFDGRSIPLIRFNRSAQKVALDRYKCTECLKTYLIHVLRDKE